MTYLFGELGKIIDELKEFIGEFIGEPGNARVGAIEFREFYRR